jgi:hypothetical protein
LYHDGRFPTLSDVVDHYDSVFNLGLKAQEKSDLVEYLKSLPSKRTSAFCQLEWRAEEKARPG